MAFGGPQRQGGTEETSKALLDLIRPPGRTSTLLGASAAPSAAASAAPSAAARTFTAYGGVPQIGAPRIG